MRLEGTLTSITELAAEELEAWELSAMRDPRNWVRPAAALVVGSAAGAALVLLRARRRAHGLEVAVGVSLAGARPRLARARAARPRARDAQAARRSLSSRRPGRERDGTQLGSARAMATCYRHPSRETGVSCSNCGRPICPDCMTTDAGRHALPGVRQPAHARSMRMRDMRERAAASPTR